MLDSGTHNVDLENRPSPRRFIRAIPVSVTRARIDLALLSIVVIVAVAGFWHIDRYPRTWFDEGSYLEVSRNLAERGRYAAESADGTLDYAPVIGVGPTVLMPIALVFSFVGSSLEHARLVPAAYLVLLTALVYMVARSLFGRTAALCTVALAVTMPGLAYLETGRQALGEVPALFFLILGGVTAIRVRSSAGVALAGVILGLAMVTKGQYLLILPSAIVLLALVDRLDARSRPLRWYVTVLSTAMLTWAVWLVLLVALVGRGDVLENVRLLRESSSGALLIFDLERMQAGWSLILGPRTFGLIPVSIVVGVWAWRKATGDRRLAILAILLFSSLWLAWFTTASIAWPRYAFPAIMLCTLFAGWLLAVLLSRARLTIQQRREAGSINLLASVAGIAMILLMVLGAQREIVPIFEQDQREPQRFAALLDDTVPPSTAVEGWEPEINYLSERTMQYPPLGSLDQVVRAAWLDGSESPDLVGSLHREYLVIGPFGRWTGVYTKAEESGDYQLILRVGMYDLLRRVDVAQHVNGR